MDSNNFVGLISIQPFHSLRLGWSLLSLTRNGRERGGGRTRGTHSKCTCGQETLLHRTWDRKASLLYVKLERDWCRSDKLHSCLHVLVQKWRRGSSAAQSRWLLSDSQTDKCNGTWSPQNCRYSVTGSVQRMGEHCVFWKPSHQSLQRSLRLKMWANLTTTATTAGGNKHFAKACLVLPLATGTSGLPSFQQPSNSLFYLHVLTTTTLWWNWWHQAWLQAWPCSHWSSLDQRQPSMSFGLEWTRNLV